MGFGSFDESEHKRREQKKDIDADQETGRANHNGDVSLDKENDTDELLDTFNEIKDGG